MDWLDTCERGRDERMIQSEQIQKPQLVLVVDDQEINRDALTVILDRDGSIPKGHGDTDNGMTLFLQKICGHCRIDAARKSNCDFHTLKYRK